MRLRNLKSKQEGDNNERGRLKRKHGHTGQLGEGITQRNLPHVPCYGREGIIVLRWKMLI
jgi:hypothetical protein